MKQIKNEMEKAFINRLNSLDKFQSLKQRRRRMSVVAPVNHKEVVLDFEERIAICNTHHYTLNRITYICSRI